MSYHVKVADTETIARAIGRRAGLYADDYGHSGCDHFDRHALHLVVERNDNLGEVLAACRVLGPAPLPLELDQYTAGVKSIALSGRVLQVGSLWVDPAYRRVAKGRPPVTVFLFVKLIELARALAVDGIVLRTGGAHRVAYYRSVGFELLRGATFEDPVWGRVVLMFMHPSNARLPRRELPTHQTVVGW